MVEQLTVNQFVAGSSPAIPVADIAQLVVQGFCKAKVASSNLAVGIGQVSEWLKEMDCKSIGHAYVGSNPTLPM